MAMIVRETKNILGKCSECNKTGKNSCPVEFTQLYPAPPSLERRTITRPRPIHIVSMTHSIHEGSVTCYQNLDDSERHSASLYVRNVNNMLSDPTYNTTKWQGEEIKQSYF